MKVSQVTVDTEVFELLSKTLKAHLEATGTQLDTKTQKLYSQFCQSYRVALSRARKKNALKRAKKRAKHLSEKLAKDLDHESTRKQWGRA